MHNNQLNLNGSTDLSRTCPDPRIENTNILNFDTTILRTLVHFSFLRSILLQPFRGCLSLLYNISIPSRIPAGRIEPRKTVLYVTDTVVVLFSTLTNVHPTTTRLGPQAWRADSAMSSNYNHLRTRSSRDHFMEPPSMVSRVVNVLPTRLALLALRTLDKPRKAVGQLPTTLRNARRAARRPTLRSFVNVPNGFIAVWFLLLMWGERWAFHSAIKQCRWENWERWVGSYLKLFWDEC
jgi:hypothetical protein